MCRLDKHVKNGPSQFFKVVDSAEALACIFQKVTFLRIAGLTCSEVIDALYNPGVYDTVYPYSYMYTWFVTLPHSILSQLAFPVDNAKYSELTDPNDL